ncbi:MAG: hypothetical protein IOC03_20480 [Burkholderia sp.]|nr:hypothetical protein [Burkholderia sp.]MCA3848516.1 hypothetical protein [Burkholderia sp.]MCA3861484.1 hypothetical protein [Burkholderia sp.]
MMAGGYPTGREEGPRSTCGECGNYVEAKDGNGVCTANLPQWVRRDYAVPLFGNVHAASSLADYCYRFVVRD